MEPGAKTYLVIGAGTAGCVIASRLSENPANRVILVEAGSDYPCDAPPADIADSYAGRALYNPGYFWPNLKAARNASASPGRYEQARVMGGGSSINGQVALRGAPADFDRWEALGAQGWNWNSILPYFRRLETDLDFRNDDHGSAGPISILRFPPEQWDGFTTAVAAAWEAEGFARRKDMNGSYEDGFAPVPVAFDGKARASSATTYLNAAVRRRGNLEIRANTQAMRLLIRDGRAIGAEVRAQNGPVARIDADHVVLCAGAIHSPLLLLKSGIGPAAHLAAEGVEPLVDLPGVGVNLQDHPTISVVAYLAPASRRKVRRHNFVNLIYSSHIEDAPPGDMVMSAICKTAWHALGDRLAALSTYIGKPCSRGRVRLSGGEADVVFNWLSDDRDVARAVQSFRMMAAMLRLPQLRPAVWEIFAAGFSPKVKMIGALTLFNRVLTTVTGAAMDASAFIRRQIIRHVASDGHTIDELLADKKLLESYLRASATGIWHPAGTCRMGDPTDPMAVVDPSGRVRGVENLTIADASIMPEIPTTNLNLPVTMIGERISDILTGRLPAR